MQGGTGRKASLANIRGLCGSWRNEGVSWQECLSRSTWWGSTLNSLGKNALTDYRVSSINDHIAALWLGGQSGG